MQASASPPSLEIREDGTRGTHIMGINHREINCYDDVVALIEFGTKNRHVGATRMNEQSSRSHSVLSTFIESKSFENGICSVKSSTFHIIDLAGSERTKDTHA